MDMTKSDVCQFLTRGTTNTHCATCAFIPYAGFSQIRSHMSNLSLHHCLHKFKVIIILHICHSSYTNAHVSQVERPLSWNQRVSVLIGTARGIAYLHSSTPTFVHQDVKSYGIICLYVYA